MFPILFGFFGFDWLQKIFNGVTMNSENNIYPLGQNAPIITTVSSGFYDIHKWIEGYFVKTYMDTRGIPTVGIGITKFSNGAKPVIGKTYDAGYLYSEYKLHIVEKTSATIKLLKSWNDLKGYDQNMFDVVCDLHFQGFTDYRKGEARKAYAISKANFANWLLTPDGMWAQFWNPKNISAYASRWGVLKRAYWRANWVMGIKKSPADCETWLKNYRAGKAVKPVFGLSL